MLRANVSGAATRVQVLLNSQGYAKAGNAHRAGLTIPVAGLLQRELTLYLLVRPQDFSVLKTRGLYAPPENRLPSVSLLDRIGQDIEILHSLYPLVWRRWVQPEFLEQGPSLRQVRSPFDNAAVRFAGVGKRLAHSEGDGQEPFTSRFFGKPDGFALCIVKHVSCLMDVG